jgi:hypothetical protein
MILYSTCSKIEHDRIKNKKFEESPIVKKKKKNTFIDLLNVLFVLDMSFKFFKYYISLLNFTFVLDRFLSLYQTCS